MPLNSVGERLRSARQRAGLTIQKVAQCLGVDKSAVVRWESGELTPKLWRITELAELLGESQEWIAFGAVPRKRKKAAS